MASMMTKNVNFCYLVKRCLSVLITPNLTRLHSIALLHSNFNLGPPKMTLTMNSLFITYRYVYLTA